MLPHLHLMPSLEFKGSDSVTRGTKKDWILLFGSLSQVLNLTARKTLARGGVGKVNSLEALNTFSGPLAFFWDRRSGEERRWRKRRKPLSSSGGVQSSRVTEDEEEKVFEFLGE
jgi:hypothetical protein